MGSRQAVSVSGGRRNASDRPRRIASHGRLGFLAEICDKLSLRFKFFRCQHLWRTEH